MRRNVYMALTFIVASASPVDAGAAKRVEFSPPIVVSTQTPDFDQSYKGKPSVLEDGTILVIYGDAVENDPAKYVFELHGGYEHPARDVFIRACDSATRDCADAANWSTPVNLSNTATRNSVSTDWRGTGVRTPYYGDAENAHVFDSGKHVVITWVDKYCPGGKQRSAVHLDFSDREIPMSCVYVAHSSGNYANADGWTIEQLSDGSRDAKQDNSRGVSSGAWILAWQEDPLGLQPGEAEGPGEGASGARVSKGTDIWYAYTSNVSAAGAGTYGVWSTPMRLTDNATGTGTHGKFNPVNDSDGNPVDPALIDKGNTGASRANIMLVGGSSPPTAAIAYEETKGSEGDEEGKYVRYHVFPYNDPPDPAKRTVDPAERAGCIISDPIENSRRVRFVTQTSAGAKSGLRMAIFWRQGEYSQGAPADIVLRYGIKSSADSASTGLRPADMVPVVDAACAALDITTANALVNAASLNISSNTPTATSANLTDTSSANSIENARAHRAIVRGDDLYLAYTYTPDGVLAQYTTLANYNLYLRRYDGTTNTWGAPVNLSNIADTTINVVEPRLVPTPGNGPGCTDPKNPTNPQDCQNKNTFYVAWGTETHVYDYVGSASDLDLYVTRTTDNAKTFEPVVVMAGTETAEGESQLQTTPDGNLLYAVWNAKDAAGSVDSWFALGAPMTLYADLSLSGAAPAEPITVDSATSLSWTVANNGPHDATQVQLSITPHADLQAGALDAACAWNGADIVCALGDLAAGATRTMTLPVTALNAGALASAATVNSALDDLVPDNNSAGATLTAVWSADLGVTLSIEYTTVDLNDIATATLAITNHGPHAAPGTTLALTLPVAWRLNAPVDGCAQNTTVVTCDLGTVDSDTVRNLTLPLLPAAFSGGVLFASVSADADDANPGDNTAQVSTAKGGSHSNVFGCALTGNAAIDPTLPLLVLLALIGASRRQSRGLFNQS